MSNSTLGQLPPAIPSFILRGHASSIQALHFFSSNTYLASADSHGWLIVWYTSSKRAVSVWKAHEGGILAVRSWGNRALITHGRDHKLRVWQLILDGKMGVDLKLPVDGAAAETGQSPWLLHSMDVGALNFCAFGMCCEHEVLTHPSSGIVTQAKLDPVLLAVPNGLDNGGVDFFQLPSEHRVCKLPSDSTIKTGMVMSLCLFYHPKTHHLTAVSGYEDGHVIVHIRADLSSPSDPWKWQIALVSKPHSQPVLSIDASPEKQYFITSSADAILTKFDIPAESIPAARSLSLPRKSINTKHAGQQSLMIRNDGKIFTTAGWDGRARVYSTKTLRELAVLKWHKEGVGAVAFANVVDSEAKEATTSATDEEDDTASPNPTSTTEIAMSTENALDLIKAARQQKAQSTHWVAAGGKDGKISLWDIY